MATRDFFAELYVAGIMGDAGWSVYFPKRDVGFDFIVSKEVGDHVLIRPVQVKGRYPSEAKSDKNNYGYIGSLSQLHHDMVLALPFFPRDTTGVAPDFIAYMPRSRIKVQTSRGYACQPARFVSGAAQPRKTYQKYIGSAGLQLIESINWANS